MYIPTSTIARFLAKDVLPQLRRMGKEHYGEQIVDIISAHALAGAAAGLAAAIPGVGSAISLVGSVGSIWSMYYRIGNAMGIKLSKSVLKALASAFIANISGTMVSIIASAVAATAISFIPGLGSVSANLIMAGVDFAVIVVAAMIYIKLLSRLTAAGVDPEQLGEDSLKGMMKETMADSDVGGMLKSARREYVKAFKSGQVTGKETVNEVP